MLNYPEKAEIARVEKLAEKATKVAVCPVTHDVERLIRQALLASGCA